jgi:hypothetical protein
MHASDINHKELQVAPGVSLFSDDAVERRESPSSSAWSCARPLLLVRATLTYAESSRKLRKSSRTARLFSAVYRDHPREQFASVSI